jgi:hypothetical protein
MRQMSWDIQRALALVNDSTMDQYVQFVHVQIFRVYGQYEPEFDDTYDETVWDYAFAAVERVYNLDILERGLEVLFTPRGQRSRVLNPVVEMDLDEALDIVNDLAQGSYLDFVHREVICPQGRYIPGEDEDYDRTAMALAFVAVEVALNEELLEFVPRDE